MNEDIRNEAIEVVADVAKEAATNGVDVLKERGIGAAIGAATVVVAQIAYKKGIKPGFKKFKDWRAARKEAKNAKTEEIAEE